MRSIALIAAGGTSAGGVAVFALTRLSQETRKRQPQKTRTEAPLAKLEAYKTLKGWNLPWVSSYGSPFNYDFHVTLDESVAPLEYNYRGKAELEQRTHESYFTSSESHGLSVLFRVNDDVFHSYSTYARGCEGLTDAYSLLDRTPYGRQEDFEDSPPGWPQKPTYG